MQPGLSGTVFENWEGDDGNDRKLVFTALANLEIK